MTRRSFLGNAFRRALGVVGFWCYGLPVLAAAETALAPAHRDFLEALLDTLIPEDDYPGAIGAGVPMQMLSSLSDDARGQRIYRRGLDALSSRIQKNDAAPFHALSLARRSEALAAIEEGFGAEALFFRRLRNDAMIAFYSSRAAYEMLGYQPPAAGYAYRPVERDGG